MIGFSESLPLNEQSLEPIDIIIMILILEFNIFKVIHNFFDDLQPIKISNTSQSIFKYFSSSNQILAFWQVDMADQIIYFRITQNRLDYSLYNLYLQISPTYQVQKLQIKANVGDILHKNDIMGWYLTPKNTRTKFLMPFTGVVIQKNEQISLSSVRVKETLAFVIRICQHEPEPKNQEDKTQKIKVSPLMKARLKCRYCQQEIWYYYDTNEKEVTLYQFKSKFDDFNLQNVQWKVALNQTFSKNTEIASFDDEAYFLDKAGKITFLFDLQNIANQANPDPNLIILRYKQVICNHEKIADGRCQFCLTPLKDIGLDDLRMYLFQMDDDFITPQTLMRGRALAEQQAQFKKEILNQKKSLLVLDLDNTILHSIQLWKLNETLIKQIKQYVILPVEDLGIPVIKTFMKIRPFFEQFLKAIIPHYEIFVYTKGTRLYAEMVCLAIRKIYNEILEGTKNFLSFRILSRDEDPDTMKKKLTYILPSLKDFLVILDDRRDVWDHSPYCIYTKPYHYFYSVQIKKEGEIQLKQVNWDKGGGSLVQNESQAQNNKDQIIQNKEEIIQNKDEIIQNKDKIIQNNEAELENQNIDKIKNKQQSQQKPNTNINVQSGQSESLKQQKVQNNEDDNNKGKPKQKGRFKQPKIPQISYTNQPDYYLLYAAHTMKQIHQQYFHSLGLEDSRKDHAGQYSDMSWVLRKYRRTLLSNLTVKFIPGCPPNIEKRAALLGLKIIPFNSQQIPNIVIRPNIIHNTTLTTKTIERNTDTRIDIHIDIHIDKDVEKTKKHHHYQHHQHHQHHKSQASSIELLKSIKHFSRTLKIPIVSESWISLCYEYSYGFAYDQYIVQNPEVQNILLQNSRYELDKGNCILQQISPKIKQKLGF